MHRLLHIAFGLCVVAAVLISMGAWRLSQGPIDISWLSDRARDALLDEASPVRVSFDHASLAWGGWSDRFDHLLELQVSGITILGPAHRTLAQAPRAWMTFSLPALLAGRFVPRTVEIDQARVLVLGDAAPGAPPPATNLDLAQLARDIAERVNGRSAGRPGVLERLIRVHLRNASLVLPAMGNLPSLRGSAIDVTMIRQRTGQLRGAIAATVETGQQSANLSASFDLIRNAESRLSLRLSPFRPSALGALPFVDGVDVPVSLSARLTLDSRFEPHAGQAFLGIGSGTVRVGKGHVPVRSGSVELSGTPDAVTLTHATFELSPDAIGAPALLRLAGTVTRQADRLSASANLGLENLNLSEIAQLWPDGVGGGTRAWVVQHVLGGVATRGSAALSLNANQSLQDIKLTQASGSLEGSGVTFTWLDNMPSVEQADVHLRLLDSDSLEILIPSARQRTGTDDPDLLIDHGTVRITGLSLPDQTTAIQLHTQASVASALALLKQPRLGLLSAHPLGFKVESGTAAATLELQFPLISQLRMDDVAIQANAHLNELRLPHVVGTNNLDKGAVDLTVTKDGLRVDGDGLLSAIPIKLQGSMDFRAGPASQIIQKIVVTGRPTAASLKTAGVDVTDVADGPIAASVTVQDRRNGSETITIDGDLTEAALSVGPLAWTKPAGTDATFNAGLSLQRGKLMAVDRFSVRGSQFAVNGSAKATAGHVSSVSLDQFQLGQTHARGTVQVAQDAPLGIVLSADTLDLSGKLTETSPDRPDDIVPATTPRWTLDARATRVILANEVHASNMVVKAQGNGEAIQTMDAVAAMDGGSRCQIRILPAPGRRALRVEADDAGMLLRGLDVMRGMQSGRLVIDATLGSLDRYHPLTGSAIIKEIRLTQAPAVVKLLQAVTIYGLPAVVEGPGMRFSRVDVPFEYDGRNILVSEARAFNPSLGLTVEGRIGTRAGGINMDGTVVPAYFFNAMLGGLPLVGKLFSPEKGGGVFAVAFSLSGDLNDPTVSVNPVSALTPGFLRNLFGKP